TWARAIGPSINCIKEAHDCTDFVNLFALDSSLVPSVTALFWNPLLGPLHIIGFRPNISQ
ncbi:hypothetical protein Ancab_005107, partial [Ancistrocladus abbreviatus]